MRGRARMAEHPAFATRQDRGKPPPLAAQARMPNRVHPSIQPTQPTGAHPMAHPTLPQPKRTQLIKRHHPPLPLSELGQRHVKGWALFRTHDVR